MTARSELHFLLSSRCFRSILFSLLVLLPVLGAERAIAQVALVTPATPSVHAQGSIQLAVNASGGYWDWDPGSGSGDIGWIGTDNVYHAPFAVPANPTAVAAYHFNGGGGKGVAVIHITNPVPVVTWMSASMLTQTSTQMILRGSGFLRNSQVSFNGVAMPTQYVSNDWLDVSVNLPAGTKGPITLNVTNPDPGSSSTPLALTAAVPGAPASTGSPASGSTGLPAPGTAPAPGSASVHSQGTLQLPLPAAGGYWDWGPGSGAGDIGFVDSVGMYHAPVVVPAQPTAVAVYRWNGGGSAQSTTITITNPVPVVTWMTTSVLSQVATAMNLRGTGFLPTTQVLLNGVAMKTQYVSNDYLNVNAVLPSATSGPVTMTLVNPDPGSSTLSIAMQAVFPNQPVSAPAPPPSTTTTSSGTSSGSSTGTSSPGSAGTPVSTGPTSTSPTPTGPAQSGSTSTGSPSTGVPASSVPQIVPSSATLHAGTTLQLNVLNASGGYWDWAPGSGSGDIGFVDTNNVYHAPKFAPATPIAVPAYHWAHGTLTATITISNPTPSVTFVSTTTLTQLSTPLVLRGAGFLPGAQVTINGAPMQTQYVSSDWINTTAVLPSPTSQDITLGVTNPNPGASTGTYLMRAVFPGIAAISPSTLTGGFVTLSITGTGYTASSSVQMDGRPMRVTVNSATSLTATGYLPDWKTGTTAITVSPAKGSSNSATTTLPITAKPLSFDIAARFATQAAMGPRPDQVEHIQQVGLQGFLNEQFQQPGLTFPANVLPRYPYLEAVNYGNSLLRLRVSSALESFIINQATDQEFQTFAPWEQKLEADAFGNFRSLMDDMISDARMAEFLNLTGNYAATGTTHPNQNFPREIMQLFTMGPNLLNDDGSLQTDSQGRVLPAYDLNTILDLSRALTGWTNGPHKNPAYTTAGAFGVDYSQPLVGLDQYHDHGAKTLFGNVNLPAGQDVTTDRKAALDAIFNHPNVPPFIATHLISQLVTSNPSPAYVKRISAVFENNGKNVRGDLKAVVTAILLDPEARAGDTAPVAANEGFLQDPLLWESFVINILQQSGWDGQPTYVPGKLGQDFWHANSVFGFYPASYAIPGTTINSPQFSLLNNLTQLHRSQYLYGVIAGGTSGFSNAYQKNSWLYTAFTNVPDLVDGLNHLVYHGQMPLALQTAITTYCAGIPNQTDAFTAAIFLALNSDSFNIVH